MSDKTEDHCRCCHRDVKTVPGSGKPDDICLDCIKEQADLDAELEDGEAHECPDSDPKPRWGINGQCVVCYGGI